MGIDIKLEEISETGDLELKREAGILGRGTAIGKVLGAHVRTLRK